MNPNVLANFAGRMYGLNAAKNSANLEEARIAVLHSYRRILKAIPSILKVDNVVCWAEIHVESIGWELIE